MLAGILAVVDVVDVVVRVCLRVCHKPVLYQNGCTDRAVSFCLRASLDLCNTVF